MGERFTRLQAKAEAIQAYIETNACDEHGILYSYINRDTGKPWTDAELEHCDSFTLPGIGKAELLAYEDSGIASGIYLALLVTKYRLTGAETDYARALRTFGAIRHIYNLGRDAREAGFFPKCYGGRASAQISSDQYIYALRGMDSFYDIATEDVKAEIRTMVESMVDFWVTRRYRHDYYTIKDMQWPIGRFAAFNLIAFRLTGRTRFLDEFQRLNSEHQVYKTAADSILRYTVGRPYSPYELKYRKGYLLTALEDCAAMEVLALEALLRYSDAHTADWLRVAQESIAEGRLALTPDLLAYRHVFYQPETGTVTPVEVTERLQDAEVLPWSFFNWRGNIGTPRSTALARAIMQMQRFAPQPAERELAWRILAQVELEQMVEFLALAPGALAPEYQFMEKNFCTSAATHWLWAYYEGLDQEKAGEK